MVEHKTMKIEIKPYDLAETIVDSIIQDLSERNGNERWRDSSDNVIKMVHDEWVVRVAKIFYEQLEPVMDEDVTVTFPPLEVSERDSCKMCWGLGRVMCTPGRGEPYEVPCEYCGGCGKMGFI